jgi:hypothetical protein
MVLAPLLWSCQSTPDTDISISSESSLLAVDVLFPAPLSRDPSLVQVFFVKGSIHRGLEELPELIPPTFVKWSRAYLLDPEPGTYSLVAVSSAFAPPWNDYPIAGVTQTRWSGTSADATIFPAELIERTRTTVAPGRVAFMGALQVRQGDRLDANAAFQDDLQRRIAERIRPGVTSESGLAGWLKRTRMVDLEETSLSNEAGDLESFFDDALEDLGDSPWVRVIARAADRETADAVARAPAPRARRKAGPPETAVTKPQPSGPRVATQEPGDVTQPPESATQPPMSATQQPKPATTDPTVATRELETVTRQPEAPPPIPKRRRVSGLPPDSPLAEIELGMSHHEVREILGPPDDRIDRTTAKAWIPFYNGPGAYLRDWIYEGEGRVVFSMHHSSLEVLDVIYAPHGAK